MMRKLTITGSLIGGMPETQACIDFCHKHSIVPKIKLVKWTDLGQVYQELSSKNDSIIRSARKLFGGPKLILLYLRNVLDIEASKAA